ncbi:MULTISPECIES: DUF637 domain-containing protein, partial [unclassified Pseudomonas]|uniref:DUF637 domain-containing protein n=3 Tax=Pseudomonas TaxID=286 RepID=UPI002B2314B1
GNVGAALKDTFSVDNLKNYLVAAGAAGLTTGLFNDWTSTSTGSGTAVTDSTKGALANTGKVIVSSPGGLGSLQGITQFTENRLLQNTTSALLNKALGRDGSLSDALQNSLVNAFKAYGFNLVGNIGNAYQLPDSELAKIGLHTLMGGLASIAAGGDFKTGALAAGVNEALVDSLASAYAGMSKDDRDRLLLMNAQLIGVLTTTVQDPTADIGKLQLGSSIAQSGTQYNYLNHEQLIAAAKEISDCKEASCRIAVTEKYQKTSLEQDIQAVVGCAADPTSCAAYSREVANAGVGLDEAYQLLGDGPHSEWDSLRNSNLEFQEMLAPVTSSHQAGAVADVLKQKWGLSDEQAADIKDALVLVAIGGAATITGAAALKRALSGQTVPGVGGTKVGAVSSGAENAALYPKLTDQLVQENLSNIAAQDSRLAAAVNGSGTKNPNFSIGQGTSSEANQLGKTWVGDGAIKTSDGLGLISADGTRVYRPPTPKDSSFATTGVQANFETYNINPVTGQRVKVSNGHLNVAD